MVKRDKLEWNLDFGPAA